ncbi:MAG: ABC transporter ATP-binding protein [Clostridiales bacterium]|nr:ABC transporter ATP-binding protein [Clostridiales bacterium]
MPIQKGVLGRTIKLLFKSYPKMVPIALVLTIVNAIISSLPAIFMFLVNSYVEEAVNAIVAGVVPIDSGWAVYGGEVTKYMLILISLYVVSLISGAINKQLLAIITQGFLKKTREQMFNGMQNLPIKYFDTHNNGDIMSYYTNDIDALRQMVGESIPQLITSVIMVITLFLIMIVFSVWLTLVVFFGIALILIVTKIVGGGAGKYFLAQQRATGKMEGFVEEMMNGQKVVKVFCHEEEAKADFDKVNDYLCDQSNRAHRYANMLMPILGNIGHVMYVVVAILGGVFILNGISNVSVGALFSDGLANIISDEIDLSIIGIPLVVSFLQTTRQFFNNINQVSNQVNSVVMGIAGAKRVFDLIDEKSEVDNGYVTLVNAKEVDGQIVECEEFTKMWAWKHPHGDGTTTYTKLCGDVVLSEVDFEYEEGKPVLHDVSIFAKPGQKVAFVGATGAGKTTITNLINRFYDIADGKIRYDGININKIKKADLRRSLGIVLQETNLFTGTVMDNIRYGKLNATDDECIAAAKLAGADDFITRLPDGYNTLLTGNGANLSQGQRQLVAIARAAVADPPVMILDEATSSIDTRTEAIVSRGMDALMQGRTVFVIAHRLSTVRNSDVIIVLDHGRIIERGSHEKLIEERGQYYQLYTGAFELE